MERPGATTMRGNPLTLIGPELKPGDTAPDFSLVDNALKPVTLKDTGNHVRIMSVVPSLDTPVCSMQTKKFNDNLAALKDKVAAFTISLDMPFAQKRFCSAENVVNLQNLSDVHDHSFGQNYGVLIEGLPLALLSRAVFVIDKNGTITYVEYVPEVGAHPNYDAAMAALNAIA